METPVNQKKMNARSGESARGARGARDGESARSEESANVVANKTSPLGLIAGGGDFPLKIQQAVMATGRAVITLGIENTCDPLLQTDKIIRIEKFGAFSRFLKKKGCEEIVIIGHITRPNLLTIRPDMAGLKVLGRVLMQARRGDNKIIEEGIRYFTEQGFTIVGAHNILAELLAPKGILTRHRPNKIARQDIDMGIDITREIGRLDIGQASVVCRGQVLAVEGVDGTDALLERIANLDENLRGTVKKRHGVLVKLPKPHQERRVDLPALGQTSIENAAAAGLAGIVFEENGALINDLKACTALANRLGIFLLGIPASMEEAEVASEVAEVVAEVAEEI